MLARLGAVVIGLAAAGAAARQAESQPTPAELLTDFIHYVRIDRPDLAASVGRQLLDRGLKDTEFVDLVESGDDLARFEEALGRAMRSPEAEAIAGALEKSYVRGKLARTRDPNEVSRNIGLLTGQARGRLLARERLAAAGEYAMPQLLGALLQKTDPVLRSEVQRLMIDMGQQAVAPLCAALLELDPGGQEIVAEILGQTRYRTAVPFLAELAASTPAQRVREACERSLARLGGAGAPDPADLYTDLGEAYYAERAEVTSFPNESVQLAWSYDPAIGLLMTPVDTAVFHEALAMRLSERSLRLRQENVRALALWLSANFSREIDTPQGYQNPMYAPERRDAMYYAVAAGSDAAQLVLARGLADRDTPLIRRALAALTQTAGGNVVGSGSRSPLTDAIRYPNRRVQYDAALALAGAQPRSSFDGAERVVPLLASAVRDAGSSFAVVLADDAERYQGYRRVLQGMGFTVLPDGRRLADVEAAIAEVPGVDLVLTALSPDATAAAIEEAHASPALAATPVLALAPSPEVPRLSQVYRRDAGVMVRPTGVADDVLAAAVDQLILVASGGRIDAEEARVYTERSLHALRDLALAQNPVLNVADAALPLIGVLAGAEGQRQLQVADILARVPQKRAQSAIMDAALSASGSQRVALLGLTADSAKRFGNLLDARQVERVVEMAQSGADDEATAAAALMGSLGVPNMNLVPLILADGTD